METKLKNEYDILRQHEETILNYSRENLDYKRDDFYNIPWGERCI
jgi:hypothetical protein